MKFSIITASCGQPGWLKRCVRSVADQLSEGEASFDLEHLVQEKAGANDPPSSFHEASRVRVSHEEDTGLYDALNRASRRATGDVIGLLHCDEQYLPGALPRVAAAFARNPRLALVVGDCLLIRPDGSLLAYRRATPLRSPMILTSHLYDYTCAFFFRREWFERAGPFRSDFGTAGDAEWTSRLISRRPPARYLRDFLAAFTITGENLSLQADPQEKEKLRSLVTPVWRASAPLLQALRRLEKLLAGGYHSGPIEYAVYASHDDSVRSHFRIERPRFQHPWA